MFVLFNVTTHYMYVLFNVTVKLVDELMVFVDEILP